MPPHVAERLTNAADAIILLDQEMSSVRNEIMDAQNSSQMQSNLVKDILNNIENLYRVSSEREVTKIQTEFLRVFHTKDLKQLSASTDSLTLSQRATGPRLSTMTSAVTSLGKDAFPDALPDFDHT